MVGRTAWPVNRTVLMQSLGASSCVFRKTVKYLIIPVKNISTSHRAAVSAVSGLWRWLCDTMLAIYWQELPVCAAASTWIGVLISRALPLLAVFLINVTSPLIPQLLPVSVMLKVFKMRQLKNWIIVLYKKWSFLGMRHSEALQKRLSSCWACGDTWWPIWGAGWPGRGVPAQLQMLYLESGSGMRRVLCRNAVISENILFGAVLAFRSFANPCHCSEESSPELAYLHGFAVWIARVVKLSAQVVTGYFNP